MPGVAKGETFGFIAALGVFTFCCGIGCPDVFVGGILNLGSGNAMLASDSYAI
jgi:hypothetical protein